MGAEIITAAEWRKATGLLPRRVKPQRQQRERDELVSPLIEAFQRCGWLVHHEEDSRRDTQSDNGFPDIVALRSWHRIEVECKLDGFEPTDVQAAWLDAFARQGSTSYHWVCVWHLSDYDAALRYIQHPQTVVPPGRWDA